MTDIISLLFKVLQTEPVFTGRNEKGPFAVFEVAGKLYTLAYGDNGFIVSFYPEGRTLEKIKATYE